MNQFRMYTILSTLLNKSDITIQSLALLCDASYRSVQNDIKDINIELSKAGIKSRIVNKAGVGTFIDNCDEKSIRDLIENWHHYANGHETNQNQLTTLMLSDLFLNDYIRLNDFSMKYAVSKSTSGEIVNDARKRLQKWEVTVDSRPHYGLYLRGDELSVRKCMWDILCTLTEEEMVQFLHSSYDRAFNLKEEIIVTLQNFGIVFNDILIEQLCIFLLVCSARIEIKKYIENTNINYDNNSLGAVLANHFLSNIAGWLEGNVKENELVCLYTFLNGRYTQKASERTEISNNHIKDIIDESFTLIKTKYDYDLTHDIDVYTSLSIHIKALIDRINANNFQTNPLKDEVKSYSMLAYDMATDVSGLINTTFHTNIPDDEVSLIAIYFNLALEKLKSEKIKRRVLAVCPVGRGMSQLIARQIKKQFGDYISELKTCGYFELDKIDYSQFDYLFTLSPLDRKVPIPVIEISLNPSKEAVEKVRSKLLRADVDYPLTYMTPRSLFFNDIDAKGKEDALSQIIGHVGETIQLAPNFYDLVIAREKIVTTELQTGFAIPHPLGRSAAERSFFAVCVLKNPIRWDTKRIQIVLLSYVNGALENQDQFYDIFSHLVTEKEYEAELVRKPYYDTFVRIVKKINTELPNT